MLTNQNNTPMTAPYNPQIHHRRSIRLKGYDYTQAGAYFVTICTHNKEYLFGHVADGEMTLNTFGTIVDHQWRQVPRFFPCASLDEFRVMPNHIHGIVVIHETLNPLFPVGAKHPAQKDVKAYQNNTDDASPLHIPHTQHTRPIGTKPDSLSAIIQNFISVSTRKINHVRKHSGEKLWQRNYYEHIIRNESELNRIREYIISNPLRWAEDRENSDGFRE
jgi:REP element-mobilizing transposase RayT